MKCFPKQYFLYFRVTPKRSKTSIFVLCFVDEFRVSRVSLSDAHDCLRPYQCPHQESTETAFHTTSATPAFQHPHAMSTWNLEDMLVNIDDTAFYVNKANNHNLPSKPSQSGAHPRVWR